MEDRNSVDGGGLRGKVVLFFRWGPNLMTGILPPPSPMLLIIY